MGGLPGRHVQVWVPGLSSTTTWVPASLPSSGLWAMSACSTLGRGDVTRSCGLAMRGAYWWMSLGQPSRSLRASIMATRHCTSSPHTGPTLTDARNEPRVTGLSRGVNSALATNSVTTAMTTARTTALEKKGLKRSSMRPPPSSLHRGWWRIASAAHVDEVAPEQAAQFVVLQIGPRAAQIVGLQQLLQARARGGRLGQRQKSLPQARAAGQVGAQRSRRCMTITHPLVYQPLQPFFKQRGMAAAERLQVGHHGLGPGVLGPAAAGQLRGVVRRRVGPVADLRNGEERESATAVFEVGRRLPGLKYRSGDLSLL